MSNRELEFDLNYQKAFGKNLRNLRDSVGWTQGELYSHSKVSVYQIGRIENGHDGPNFQTLLALAYALGREPSDLFDFKYPHKLNKSFPKSISKKPGTTNLLRLLYKDNFFIRPRSVGEVVNNCKVKFNASLKSADVSGTLLQLVNKKQLRIIKLKNRNLYQNVKGRD